VGNMATYSCEHRDKKEARVANGGRRKAGFVLHERLINKKAAHTLTRRRELSQVRIMR
jgi:hypothetical protein